MDMGMELDIILIVEDNDVLRSALDEMLSNSGYVVYTAANGIEALKCLEEKTPHLIISDISMPDMDGYEFFDAVRANKHWLSIPFIFLTARGTKKDILNGKDMGVEDYLVKPVRRDELLTTVRSRLTRSNQLRIAQLREAYESSLILLANAIEVRDSYTRGHVERVRDYALLMAKILGWQDQRLEDLRFAAILHDIGKIHVRENVLLKEGPLNDEEWEEIKKHPSIGAEMVKNVPYLVSAIPAILHHHERWDGQGYPDHLAGESIPLMARIVAVADAFDAMTSNRSYQKIRSLQSAYDEIVSAVGMRYDPKVISALQKAWGMGEVQKIAGN
jgi:putative two-component system response regulator